MNVSVIRFDVKQNRNNEPEGSSIYDLR